MHEIITENDYESRVVVPDFLKGKTTGDVDPREVMGYFPKRRGWHDGLKYIIESTLPIPVSEELLQLVHDKIELYLYHANTDNPERLERDLATFEDEVWPTLKKAMSHNYGMAKLMDEYGWRSRFLARAVTVGAQAVLLELFHSGRTWSINGDFEYIPYEDAMIEMIIWETISLCMYERRKLSQEVVKCECKKRTRSGNAEPVRMVSFGAGLLPVLRADGFPQNLPLKVTAVDMDERNLENLKLVFDQPIEEVYGVDYKVMDAVEFCSDPANANKFDIGEGLGILSYYKHNHQIEAMMETLLKVIKPGGKLVCDFQLMNRHLIRCATSMGWKSDLLPHLSWFTAVYEMKKICRRLGVKVEYRRSEKLKHAAGINFIITKPKRASHRTA